jgi:hypothetical protein
LVITKVADVDTDWYWSFCAAVADTVQLPTAVNVS